MKTHTHTHTLSLSLSSDVESNEEHLVEGRKRVCEQGWMIRV